MVTWWVVKGKILAPDGTLYNNNYLFFLYSLFIGNFPLSNRTFAVSCYTLCLSKLLFVRAVK